MLEANRVAFTVLVAEDEEVLSGDRGHQVGAQFDVTDRAHFGVGHVEVAAGQRKAAGLRKACLCGRSVEESLATGAGEARDGTASEIQRPDLGRAGSWICSSAMAAALGSRMPRSSNSLSIPPTSGSNCSKGSSPSCLPMTRPCGSTNINVGQARPPNWFQTAKSRSLTTGCSIR